MSIQLVDSHCHLDRLDFEKLGEMDTIIRQAAEHDVAHMLCVSINLTEWPAMMEIVERYDNVYASVGIHPNDHCDEEPTVEQLVSLAQHPKVIAIGETGLDYFRSEGDLEWQRERFRTHIRAAKVCQKPLIIHSREAQPDTLTIMAEEGADAVGGVMHCFVDDIDTALRSIELGFYISFSGIVTFRTALELKEVAKSIPLERMLVETDSPYLTPVPYRGKTNQPAYTKYVAEHIAELREIDYQTVARTTTDNFFQLFNIAR